MLRLSASRPFLYQGTAKIRHCKRRSGLDERNPGYGTHPLLPSTNEANARADITPRRLRTDDTGPN